MEIDQAKRATSNMESTALVRSSVWGSDQAENYIVLPEDSVFGSQNESSHNSSCFLRELNSQIRIFGC